MVYASFKLDREEALETAAGLDRLRKAGRLLGLYFALVEQAVSWIEHNPLDRRS
jgi:hypothetical protein